MSPLTDTIPSSIIKFLKVQFSRHGIPDVLVSDNGPQYISNEFRYSLPMNGNLDMFPHPTSDTMF